MLYLTWDMSNYEFLSIGWIHFLCHGFSTQNSLDSKQQLKKKVERINLTVEFHPLHASALLSWLFIRANFQKQREWLLFSLMHDVPSQLDISSSSTWNAFQPISLHFSFSAQAQSIWPHPCFSLWNWSMPNIFSSVDNLFLNQWLRMQHNIA